MVGDGEMSDIPPTIEAAIASGWEGLRVECNKPGHGVTVFPWRMLIERAGGNKRASLAYFATRLKCKYCGERPSAIYVERRIDGQNEPHERELLQVPLPGPSSAVPSPEGS